MSSKDTLILRNVFNCAPLLNEFIGYDELFKRMERVYTINEASNYPPYDIYSEKIFTQDGPDASEEEHYFIDLAVAGFSKEELSVEMSKDGILTIKNIPAAGIKERKYFKKGIANRDFKIQKTISQELELVNCSLVNGILSIEFKRKDISEMENINKIEIK